MLKLLEQGRLEIVSGGWVMPDEANSHYTAMLEQLMHGQATLRLFLWHYVIDL